MGTTMPEPPAPQRFPAIEPYAHGHLDVGDGNRIYWETSGNPSGKPALVVHGGPGGGGKRGARRSFDPGDYRIVLFDQRGCGQSLPHAADPAVDLSVNTTEHLIADMERLREHLGIEQWLLYGGSWGSTLILAYAERYPTRVTEIILIGVTMTRPEETDWLYRGVGRFLPGPWAAFRDALPAAERDGNLVAAYHRLTNDPDPAVRARAARAWCAWEDAVIAHETQGSPGYYSAKPEADLFAFVRICTHYFANDAWLPDGQLLRDAPALAGIPGVLIHGRLDLSSPLYTAWQLAQAWPEAELHVIDDSGHTGSARMLRAILDATARFGSSGRQTGVGEGDQLGPDPRPVESVGTVADRGEQGGQ
ncbi:prolyl aminopeptidase [Nocardia brasiliensis]|uniref:Proline iminopeptidase n=1 Tax=Nocardia brasiliensis TaxID=37326 RepID=A0A6G9XV27_NOCBR|nr:prolyl aminopeptidase [Nocardia brasiliensis]QIS04759.1 prolyl aminopeptidase [Nocardia brasiliensis]